MIQGRAEEAPRPREIGARARAAVEHRRVVEETGPLLLGREREIREQAPEVVRQVACQGGLAPFAQLFLRAEPVAIGPDRVLAQLPFEVLAQAAAVHGAHQTTPRLAAHSGSPGRAKYDLLWKGLFSWLIRRHSTPMGSPRKSRGARAESGSSKTNVVVYDWPGASLRVRGVEVPCRRSQSRVARGDGA